MIQHGFAGLKTDLGAFRPHDHGDQPQPLPLGRSGQAVACPGGKAGFQPRGPIVKPDQLIGIGQAKGPVPDGVHPYCGEFLNIRVVFQQLPGHPGDIHGGGAVLPGFLAVIQTGAVDEVGVFHSQLLGPPVHLLDEGLLGTGDVLSQRTGAVIGRGHRHGFEHIRHGHGLAHLQIDLTAPFGGSGLGGGDGILPSDLPGVNGLHHQQHGHHLGDTGRSQRLVGILRV